MFQQHFEWQEVGSQKLQTEDVHELMAAISSCLWRKTLVEFPLSIFSFITLTKWGMTVILKSIAIPIFVYGQKTVFKNIKT